MKLKSLSQDEDFEKKMMSSPQHKNNRNDEDQQPQIIMEVDEHNNTHNTNQIENDTEILQKVKNEIIQHDMETKERLRKSQHQESAEVKQQDQSTPKQKLLVDIIDKLCSALAAASPEFKSNYENKL